MNRAIMIVGASGVFGSRLVTQLAIKGHRNFILAGRDEAKASDILRELRGLNCEASFCIFDRSQPDVALLKRLAPYIIVDAAGPFQGSSLALPKAAIAAGVHYLDLADARDFVARISTLDQAAKAAGVAVISGASSTPALSHAVLDRVIKGWKRIDEILVAIAPGNRAPRGLSVMKAILAGVGEPIRLLQNGKGGQSFGWAEDEQIEIAGVGRRHIALCETPDLDLLVERYHPRVSAEFKAGLELGIMHNSLRVLAALRAKKLIPNLAPLAGIFQFLARPLYPFGSDAGGMFIRVTGLNERGAATRLCWSLAAKGGVGPNIPCLPALALCLRDELDAGAYSAAGVVSYDEMDTEFRRLGISTNMDVELVDAPQVFQSALGEAWDQLPSITRYVHTLDPIVRLKGEADIEGAQTALGRVVAKIFGFPGTAKQAALSVTISKSGKGESWARHYPDRTMRSVISLVDAKQSLIEERFGPFQFQMRLTGNSDGLDMIMVGMRFLGVPLPAFLLPKLVATERTNAEGKHLFNVDIKQWPFGRLVHYNGWLKRDLGWLKPDLD